jgi:GNAT superfamily N-acetyltransferase
MLITDHARIRGLLRTDPAWSAYALGDLAPGFFEHSEWHGLAGEPAALLLFYRAFADPVLFALGPPERVGRLLSDAPPEPRLYLSIRPEIVPLIRARYRVEGETPMWRMRLDPAAFPGAQPGPACRLGPADLPALRALYADGEATGEAPDFFDAAMLEQGVFYGVREGDGLAAAAGTHLVAPSEGVAAIGNVYTRRERRGQGLAQLTTAAVVGELTARATPLLIVLNVNQANTPAIRIYERLGFRRYCAFVEGMALPPSGIIQIHTRAGPTRQ